MKTAHVLAVVFVTVLSIPFLALQTASTQQQPAQEQAAPPAAQTNAAPAPAAAPSAEMSPVNGELVEKLDSKTAKTGDSVVIKTRSNVKTADGTEIPKGSKLVGHVTGVKPSGDGNENSQVALQFDRAELKGGQTVAIQTEIQSLSPPAGESPSNPPDAMISSPGSVPGGMSSGASSNMPGGTSRSTMGAPTGGASPMPGQAGTSPTSDAASAGPAAGTVVARTGNIAIRATAIPGVMLANNEPGQQDPRMARSSGILLGAKRDIHLDGGTQVVIGVAAAQGAAGGGN
jgi:hypothetical protein